MLCVLSNRGGGGTQKISKYNCTKKRRKKKDKLMSDMIDDEVSV